ncbi:MAG: choice-of-anchor B family protein [Phycisphaerales bacterium]|nr:choice-of-anchor B family protein [Phycisphaerales bacterium]
MLKLQALSAVLAGVAIGATALAHQDDPKLRDRQPPVQAPAFRADVNGINAHSQRGGFTSEGVTLLSWLSLSALGGYDTGNDCWGYVSPSGREYAIMGVNSATIFIDITNPGNAQIIATISGPDSLWRDVKIFGHHCYAVSEGGSGIQVIDMVNIDIGVVTLVNVIDDVGTSATHNVAIDTVSGFLYRLGGSDNGCRIYDLNSNPASPAYVGSWNDKYVHDAQFVTYPAGTPYAGKQIGFLCAGFNGGWEQTGLTILDLTDKSNIVQLSSYQYSNNNYSHQGWLTEDFQRFYLNDELDESNTGSVTTTRILDVSNLSAPTQAGTCTTGLSSIDHNLYIKGNRMYQANYRSGLQIFDISDQLNPTRVAWFDTYPSDDGASFNGAWSSFPYFPSGTIIVSDLERGFFAFQTADIEIALVDDLPSMLPSNGASLDVRIRGLGSGQPDSTTFFLSVDDGSGSQDIPLAATADPDIWTVNFPDMTCGNFANWSLSASSTSGQTVTLPIGGSNYETLVADGAVTGFSDDFESDLGWTVDSTCTDGPWGRGVPVDSDRGDPPSDADGSGQCYVTDNASGNSDVDGGLTVLTSPAMDASAPGAILSYWRWYSNDFGGAPNADVFTVEVSDDNGGTWSVLEIVGPTGIECSGGWYNKQFPIAGMPGISPSATFRVRFTAEDAGNGSVIEAGVDGVSISAIECDEVNDCPADCANGDGVVDVTDVLALLAQFGNPGGCDIDNSGVVDVNDMLDVIASWGLCP